MERISIICKLEMMVKDLKDKLDIFEKDKRSSMYKNDKTKRDAFAAKYEQEKKDLEDKLQKMKSQFEIS